MTLSAEEIAEIHARLLQLRSEHQLLAREIQEFECAASPDQLQLCRLKKRKLQLKDRIEQLECLLVPDISA